MVSLDTTGTNKIPKGCTKDMLPECKVYEVSANTFVIATPSTTGKVIGCKTCNTGFDAFAIANSAGFTYLGVTTNGVACPGDGTYDCTAM